MADEKRKKGKAKPLTANPLFPAVVALWCGAALGLPSLALGPSALEALVIKSRIDLVFPAAAPPLGLTARILLALVLAVIGAVIGVMIGRRIARPRIEPKERKRGARQNESSPSLRVRDSHPDAPARRPISAHEELGETIAPEGIVPATLGTRRRALTVAEEPVHFVPQEVAPLPGGQPQVLDLAGAELEQLVPVAASNVATQDEAQPDLNAYADKSGTRHDQLWPPVLAAPSAVDRHEVQATVAADLEASDAPDHQTFHAAEAEIAPDLADSDASPGRQVFGMAPVEPADPASRQIFGVTATADHVPTEFVKAAGYKSSVFDNEPVAPLFPVRTEHAVGRPDTVASLAPTEVVAALEVPPLAATLSPPPPVEQLRPVADLGMTELAVRLQESMRRRRAARVVAAQPAVVTSPQPAFSQLPADAPMAAPIAPAAINDLPAAMRPISFDAFDAEADEPLDSLLPPRMITASPVAAVLHPAGVAIGDEQADDDAGYASLLQIAPSDAATPFVRIEEPEPQDDAIEPVVIFPGQAPRLPADAAPTSRSADVADPTEPQSFRAFDAPSTASAGQAVSASQAAPTIDPGEAERALRAALSSLQRISGAA